MQKALFSIFISLMTFAMPMRGEGLHVSGNQLVDDDGKVVLLHGFGQTYSPWFNEEGRGWGWSYNTGDCLKYNKALIDKSLANGWKMDWLRLHMDPYWSNTPGISTTGENDISAFSMSRFKQYLGSVFVPMAEYAIQKGLYVVMRPPGVCPQNIAVGDNYQKYLIQVWKEVASNEKLKNNPYVMFELANEPVNVTGSITRFFQDIVDTIRAQGCDNILWIPGSGYQSDYRAYADNPIKGSNIGYAVHCYPGWYGSDCEVESAELGGQDGGGYLGFYMGWQAQVGCVAKFAPILVTEMDWAPSKYNASWGKAYTGKAGDRGFGANFKYIADKTGNVSWMIFTSPDQIAKYDDSAPDGNTFFTDPEACVRPVYRWFKEYADPDWQFVDTVKIKHDEATFPLTDKDFNPSIWETGSFDETTGCLITGQYGFGGWKYPNGIDLSAWKYLVVKLAKAPSGGGWSFRIFDEANYWTGCYMKDIGSAKQCVVSLQQMYRSDTQVKVDPSHIFIVGFWSYGGQPLYISDVYLTNNNDFSKDTGIGAIQTLPSSPDSPFYNINGQRVKDLQPNRLVIRNGKKYILK